MRRGGKDRGDRKDGLCPLDLANPQVVQEFLHREDQMAWAKGEEDETNETHH